jgi:monomeric phenylalanine-4-hydroxylase
MVFIHVTAMPTLNMTIVEEAQKQGLTAGVAGRPRNSDWTIPQTWEKYTAAEHATWKILYERQVKLLPGRACDEFIIGMDDLPISGEAIPDFRCLNDVLMKRTGWQVVAVPGLVPDDVYFVHLASRRFPCGNFIRKREHLDYLEEPDVFHDVFGHVPMLMNPEISDFIQAYGMGGLLAQKLGNLSKLARVYWYTVEFGLVEQRNGLRLKIDQSFVRDMLDDPDDMAILEGVIGLAGAFKREVIAEGVETVEYGTALLQLGCTLAQGYGIARPMPAEQMPTWAATWQPDSAWCTLSGADDVLRKREAQSSL